MEYLQTKFKPLTSHCTFCVFDVTSFDAPNVSIDNISIRMEIHIAMAFGTVHSSWESILWMAHKAIAIAYMVLYKNWNMY